MRYLLIFLLSAVAIASACGAIAMTITNDQDYWSVVPMVLFAVVITALYYIHENRREIDKEFTDSRRASRT